MNLTDHVVDLDQSEPVGKAETVQWDSDSDREQSSGLPSTPTDWSSLVSNLDIDSDQQNQLIQLLNKYRNVFAFSSAKLGYSTASEHRIDTPNHPPYQTPDATLATLLPARTGGPARMVSSERGNSAFIISLGSPGCHGAQEKWRMSNVR